MITEACVEKIKSSARIEEVVGEFLHLKKSGSNLKAPCPFHNEKSASFTVSPAKGIYKCFGCGKTGDSVQFVLDHEKYTYVETLRWIAKRYNIEVEETEASQGDKDKMQEVESIYKINQFAAKYFMACLDSNSEALDYLLNKRGFSRETITKFQIGAAPEGYRDLYDHAIENHFSQDLLIKSDLVYEKNGKIFDRFRNRIVFPILNLAGHIVGFTGRIMRDDPKAPKYLNTAENAIFLKRETLYGMHLAKHAISKMKTDDREAILVEGQADVVSMHQAEFNNTVASSGTALTAQQVKHITRFTDRILILYDSDNAGFKATIRALEITLKEGMSVRLAPLPAGEDPDSFIQKNGGEVLRAYIQENRKKLVDFVFMGFDQLSAEERDERGKTIIRLIAHIPEDKEFSINDYCKRLAEFYKVHSDKVRIRVKQLRAELKLNHDAEANIQELKKEPDTKPAEIQWAKLLLKYGHLEYREGVWCYFHMISNAFTPARFGNPVASKIFQEYYDMLVRNKSLPTEETIDYFIKHPDPEISALAIDVAFDTDHHKISTQWAVDGPIPEVDFRKEVDRANQYLYDSIVSDKIEDLKQQLTIETDLDKISELIKELLNFVAMLSDHRLMHRVNAV